MCKSGYKERQIKVLGYSKLLCRSHNVTLLHWLSQRQIYSIIRLFNYSIIAMDQDHPKRGTTTIAPARTSPFWISTNHFHGVQATQVWCGSPISCPLHFRPSVQLLNSLPNIPDTWGFMVKGFILTFSLAPLAGKWSHGSTDGGKLLIKFTPTLTPSLHFAVLGPSPSPHDDPTSYAVHPKKTSEGLYFLLHNQLHIPELAWKS